MARYKNRHAVDDDTVFATKHLQEGMIIFVTIGVPFSRIPIMQKAMLFVDQSTDTPVTVAKNLRKHVADNIEMFGWVKGTEFEPSELYYQIFGSVDNQIPFSVSSNSPVRSHNG